jgi:hypothetical protein
MLSPVLLEELRAHWRRLRKRSDTWLFPGNRWHSSDQPMDTHRVAISDWSRWPDGQVTFRWRDSADHNQQKLMTLSLDEFLRRFLLHLLPKGFVRIRQLGFLANRRRSTLLPLCFAVLAPFLRPSNQKHPPPRNRTLFGVAPSVADRWR